MQTFLPYVGFEDSAKVLDYRRLGKQRIEAKTIYNILTGKSKSNAWTNHPCCRMWSGFENALASYYNVIVSEWINRGYKNTMEFIPIVGEIVMPDWLNDDFCSFHRSTLLHKNCEFYKQYDWKEIPKYEYIWPKNN